MAPSRSSNRELSLKLWIKSKGTMTPKQIGDQLGVSNTLIRKWKFLDDWDNVPLKRPRGGQIGNKNAIGNTGGSGGPYGNDFALKHGYYAKYLPEDILSIVNEIEDEDPLEHQWRNIMILQAKLLHAQRIMHVTDKADETKVITKETRGDKSYSYEWEYQHAWDKFSAASKADVLIMREIRSAIKQYLSAAPDNDERKLKLQIMDTQLQKNKIELKELSDSDGSAGVKIIDNIPRGDTP